MNIPVPDPALVRGVGLFLPLAAAAIAAAARPPGPREVGAAVVATAWSCAALYPLNLAAVRTGWWEFHAEGAVLHGVPVDLLIGWAVLWGALPALLDRTAVPLPLVVLACGWLDLVLMPLAGPVVVLGPDWLVGEAAGLLLCLLPAALLARWTRLGVLLPARMWAQALLAAALMLLLPLHLLGAGPAWPPPWDAAGTQVLLLLLLPGLAAAREFASAGGGTPLPYDPPVRLVSSGPYSYVRNPMQTAVVSAYAGCAALTGEPLMLAAAAAAFAYGAGFASWHEGGQLERAFGPDWRRYADGVRPWLPAWRPWTGRPPARLYVARTCGLCSGVAGWLTARDPVALRLLPAETHPGAPRRLTYETADGRAVSGTAAFAKALEHLNLGWALLGWAIALPGVAQLVQLAADAFGAGPRTPVPGPGEPGAGVPGRRRHPVLRKSILGGTGSSDSSSVQPPIESPGSASSIAPAVVQPHVHPSTVANPPLPPPPGATSPRPSK
ncbi:methyltransferase [Actinorugispora endophytica]|uniref:Protein-S-isoprenylcysteine O-methyltransferase Ste14 n=1 Tax=Actinorugispora endophytica TaxID=1605990 RepID=A0A4R6V0I0_9ACTN|nr:methyltransferase [Actinorugispora endophytica]TDQ51435.1 protein-S-isoprenylcysteine O-methyltransferase Ste14 [Actinorugispora endophytica]